MNEDGVMEVLREIIINLGVSKNQVAHFPKMLKFHIPRPESSTAEFWTPHVKQRGLLVIQAGV